MCRTQGKGTGLHRARAEAGWSHWETEARAPRLGGFRGGEFITGEAFPWTQQDQSTQSVQVSASRISKPKLACFISSSSRVPRRRHLGIRSPPPLGNVFRPSFLSFPFSDSIFIFLRSASTCPRRLFANFTGNRWHGTYVSFGLRYWLHDPEEVV